MPHLLCTSFFDGDSRAPESALAKIRRTLPIAPALASPMNFNTLCLRIFFVLFLLLIGSMGLFLYGKRVFTPLAVSVLPSTVTDAHYSSSIALVEFSGNSSSVIIHSDIVYDGNWATIFTATPPVPPVEPERPAARFLANLARATGQPAPPETPPPPFLTKVSVTTSPAIPSEERHIVRVHVGSTIFVFQLRIRVNLHTDRPLGTAGDKALHHEPIRAKAKLVLTFPFGRKRRCVRLLDFIRSIPHAGRRAVPPCVA
jgi:hypothetical protein